MSESIVKEVLISTIKELEETGDIVVVNPAENAVANRLFSAVQEVSPNILSPAELGGIINALNAHKLGFGLDDNDFQTIIGLTKEELSAAAKKLKVSEW
jgi:hypothetical protein